MEFCLDIHVTEVYMTPAINIYLTHVTNLWAIIYETCEDFWITLRAALSYLVIQTHITFQHHATTDTLVEAAGLTGGPCLRCDHTVPTAVTGKLLVELILQHPTEKTLQHISWYKLQSFSTTCLLSNINSLRVSVLDFCSSLCYWQRCKHGKGFN